MAFSPESFAKFLRALPRSIDDDEFEGELRESANLIREIQKDNFARESDAKGVAWPPRKRPYPHPPLRKTLKMFMAATQRSAAGSIEIISRRQLRVGIDRSEVPYAKFHQFGTSRLPQRKFFYVNRKARRVLHAPARAGLRRILRVQQKRFQANG